MPHIIIKLYAGRSEQQKKELTEKIVTSAAKSLECKTSSISVAFEEFKPENWIEAVYKPDIMNGSATLYKNPEYNPFDQEPGHTDPDKTLNLTEHVRNAAELAARQDTSGIFNPMSWLDTELEDNPASFDPFFDTPWEKLSERGQGERMKAVRRVL
ncbi:MAG: tautomerase family protein [Desulfobacter sp.]|nr:tautomerase family protein [Desulfobacter sp.]WDP85022.1 MAG: tautomerase family protein [Desulfobacter sp.]